MQSTATAIATLAGEILPARDPRVSRDPQGRIARDVEPIVGMACTMPTGSDSTPGTVIEVKARGGRAYAVVVQEDTYRPVQNSNYYGVQSYVYRRNPEGQTETYTRRKDGRWLAKGVPLRACGYGAVYFGNRRAYRDPHF